MDYSKPNNMEIGEKADLMAKHSFGRFLFFKVSPSASMFINYDTIYRIEFYAGGRAAFWYAGGKQFELSDMTKSDFERVLEFLGVI